MLPLNSKKGPDYCSKYFIIQLGKIYTDIYNYVSEQMNSSNIQQHKKISVFIIFHSFSTICSFYGYSCLQYHRYNATQNELNLLNIRKSNLKYLIICDVSMQ